jgi:NAD(P)H dehydrogenase (quinone)
MIYRVATSEATSFADIALMLGELTGKRIPYTDAPREAYIETLTKAGIPDQYIRVTAGFIEAIKQGEFDSDNHDLERLLYRKPVTLKEFLKAIYVQS